MSLRMRVANYRSTDSCLFRNWSDFGVTKTDVGILCSFSFFRQDADP